MFLFWSWAVLYLRVGYTTDILSLFISVLSHFDRLFQGESCPCINIMRGLPLPLSGSWEVRCTWQLPFLWPLTNLPGRHTFCAFCPVLSLLLWGILLGPHQHLWLCDLLSDWCHKQPLNEVVEALVANILVQFISLLHRNTILHNTLSTCMRICAASVKFSPFADSIHCRRGWSIWVIDLTVCKSCLEFPFEFTSSNSTPSSCCCCLSTLHFLCTSAFSSWDRFLSLPFASLFPWLLRKSVSISFSFATWRIQSFLWLHPAGLSWYLSRDFLGLPHFVQPPMTNLLVTLLQTVLLSLLWVPGDSEAECFSVVVF